MKIRDSLVWSSRRATRAAVLGLLIVAPFGMAQPTLPAVIRDNTDQQERIDKTVEQLKGESLNDSIKILSSQDTYASRVYHHSRKGYQSDLEMMLSNRRSVKVVQELSRLAEGEREQACKDAFESLLGKHEAALMRIIAHAENPDSPRNYQSLLATKLSICTILFAESRLKLRSAVSSQLNSLQELKSRINNRMLASKAAFDPIFILVMNKSCVPDNRFIANIALSLTEGPRNEKLRGFLLPDVVYLPIMAWDAKTTWFDSPFPYEAEPLPPPKGVEEFIKLYNFNGSLYFDTEYQAVIVLYLTSCMDI